MKTRREVDGGVTSFVLFDVPREFEETVTHLGFQRRDDGFIREFPTEARHIHSAYENFVRYAEEMVLQAAGHKRGPWETAFIALMDRLDEHDIRWWLTGSGALAVRGLDIAPKDLDLVVDDASATGLGDVLADRLVEPVAPVTNWLSRWWGRAFLHMRIEWVGGVDNRVDDAFVTEFGPTAASRLETVTWNGRTVRVPPLVLQLAVSEQRALDARAAAIRDLIARRS